MDWSTLSTLITSLTPVDVEGLLTGAIITLYAGIKAYVFWNKKKLDSLQEEKIQDKRDNINDEYLNLIKTLREEVDRLKEDLEELNVLRLKNRQLHHKIEELEKE